MKPCLLVVLALGACALGHPTRQRRYLTPFLSAGNNQAALLSSGGIGGVYDQKDAAHHLQDHVAFTGQTQSGLQDGHHYLGDTSYGTAAQGNQQGADSKGWVKGHHSNGFQKTYHKDEAGSDSSFYDSDHDEGSHFGGQGYGQFFGSHGTSGYGSAGGKGALEVGSRGLHSTTSSGGAGGALLHHNQAHHLQNGQHLIGEKVLAGPIAASGAHFLGPEAGLYRPELLGQSAGLFKGGAPFLGGELVKKPPIYPLAY